MAWKETAKHRSPSSVEVRCPNAHEASLCIARHLDGPARERESLGRRRDEDEPRAVRDGEVAGPRGPCLDAAGEPLGYGVQERHPLLARERLAGRSTRDLLAIGNRLGEKRSSGTVANHVDELSCPGAHLVHVRDKDKALSVGDHVVGGAFGPRLQPTPEACWGALEEFLAALPGDLPSYRPPFEVSDLGVAVGIPPVSD